MRLEMFNIMKKTIVGLLICSVIFIIALVATAKVTLTPSGSYYKLYLFEKVALQLSNSGLAEKPNFIRRPFTAPIVELNDDPITTNDGANNVHWYCLNKAYSQKVMQQKIHINCQGQSHSFEWSNTLGSTVIEQDILADNILVLSDIHGDIDYLNSILIQMNIVDEDGNWQWNKNQIVVTGDSVDKGPADFYVLWRLYQLSQQAKGAGGAVHVLIGNHEHYQLRGNHSRLNADMRVKSFAMVENLTQSNSPYSHKTILGQWLRSRPVALRLGKYLFTHGGLSKSHLNSHYSLADLNESVWEYYRKTEHSALKPSDKLDLALGREGLIWFRGQLRNDRSKTPNSKELAKILTMYGAEVLVIGHSAMDTLEVRLDNQVWPAHSKHSSGQVLLIEHGQASMRKLQVEWYDYGFLRREIRKTKRPLRLFSNSDGISELPVVSKMYKNITELHRRKNSY
jgi:hypothetical protein